MLTRAVLYQLDRDSATGDQLVDENDRGNDQQQMYQVTAYAAEQSQQPEHDKYCNNRPEHCFLLLRIKPLSAFSNQGAKEANYSLSRLDYLKCKGRAARICNLRLFSASNPLANNYRSRIDRAIIQLGARASWRLSWPKLIEPQRNDPLTPRLPCARPSSPAPSWSACLFPTRSSYRRRIFY